MAGSIKGEFIIDASFVLAFLLPDERSAFVDDFWGQVGQGKLRIFSPPLLVFEVASGIKLAVIRKRFNPAQGEALLDDFIALLAKIGINDVGLKDVWQTAFNKDLTIYDASYLSLAKSRKWGLLSFDKDLLPYAYKAS